MKCAVIVISVLVLCVAASGQGYAASVTNGITISPTIQQINLTAGQSSVTYPIQITNNLPYTITFELQAVDFSALNAKGGINLTPNGETEANNKHGLADHLILGDPQLVLAPGQEKSVPVTVTDSNHLAAGGHYTAIVFKLQALFNTTGNHVAINQGVASLLFIRTYGNGTQILRLSPPDLSSFTTKFPNRLNLLIQNNGNTQSTPVGLVQILAGHSRVLSQAQLNINSGMILPQSNGLFEVSMRKPDGHIWVGSYRLKVLYTPSGQSGSMVYTKRFFYIDKTLLVFLVCFIALLVMVCIKALMPRRLFKSRKSTAGYRHSRFSKR